MYMTFAELARTSPAGYCPVAWPGERGGASLAGYAIALSRTADRLVRSLEAPLLDCLLAVVSPRPEHFTLARLLACHGPRAVHFFCSQPVDWDDSLHEPLFHELL